MDGKSAQFTKRFFPEVTVCGLVHQPLFHAAHFKVVVWFACSIQLIQTASSAARRYGTLLFPPAGEEISSTFQFCLEQPAASNTQIKKSRRILITNNVTKSEILHLKSEI
jgi:hypothetical protein